MEYNVQPAILVNTKVPEAVLEEVKYNFIHHYPIKEFGVIREIFQDFLSLYRGSYQGYRGCNMPYHDINHILDTLLAFSRIVDGYNIKKQHLSVKKVKAGLIAVLFHDSGYIQKDTDLTGTGAKYTMTHEKRSVDFIRGYFKKIGLSREDFVMAGNMIKCTDFKVQLSEIDFKTQAEKFLGLAVGTADLIGQMAERAYLEKLADLYQEFEEGHVEGFESEDDLLCKTINFYKNIVKKRLDNELESVYKFARVHFNTRYRIDSNLYMNAIEKQVKYLDDIMEKEPEAYKNKLRRRG
jgi:hypothetical protein